MSSTKVDVQPFQKKGLQLGFTRGFMQSQAFVHHFGLKAVLRPPGHDLLFDTSKVSGTNNQGQTYTYLDEYEWSGYTARARIFDILNEVVANLSLHLDVFAYDLNEPDMITILLQLAKQGRVRVILDNASLHHSTSSPRPEDEFEILFTKASRSAAILRGHFGRFAHDKVFIVSDKNGAQKVLTGSTNFSVTGIYVNSNHVIVFDDPKVAAKYREVFDAAWSEKVSGPAFAQDATGGRHVRRHVQADTQDRDHILPAFRRVRRAGPGWTDGADQPGGEERRRQRPVRGDGDRYRNRASLSRAPKLARRPEDL